MNKKKISAIIVIVIAIAGLLGYGVYNINTEELANEIIEEATEETKEVVVSDKAQELAEDTQKETELGNDLSTTEEITSTEAEEQTLEEESLEADAQVEQENIAWERGHNW